MLLINISFKNQSIRKGKEMFYLTTHSTHFIYDYMASENQSINAEYSCYCNLFRIIENILTI